MAIKDLPVQRRALLEKNKMTKSTKYKVKAKAWNVVETKIDEQDRAVLIDGDEVPNWDRIAHDGKEAVHVMGKGYSHVEIQSIELEE